jgi:hypothetical protein
MVPFHATYTVRAADNFNYTLTHPQASAWAERSYEQTSKQSVWTQKK